MTSHTRLIQINGCKFDVIDNGESCWAGSERLSFWDSFEANTYDPALIGLIDQFVKPGSVFVDAGAWVGGFSLYAAARGAIALAIEPDPVAFACLQENALLSFSTGAESTEIHLFPFALSDSDDPLLLGSDVPGKGLSAIGDEGVPVSAGSLERILFTAGAEPSEVSLVKVDVEGFEMQLLPSLAPWLAARKIPLVVSLHGKMPAKEWFYGFSTVVWPEKDRHADVVALPWPRFGI